ncbi:MAG: ADP-ribosylation factor-like protein [Candidatus Hermodarchaeota archaeon]
MEELLKTSIVKGFIFSVYGELGPTPIYTFPNYVTEKELKELNMDGKNQNDLILSYRDITQISIKNLSLFISDKIIYEEKDLQKIQYFAILPYPDFKTTSLTYFHFIRTDDDHTQVPTAFSILVEENKRSFLYNNINRIKPIVYEFFNIFDKEMSDSYPPREEVESKFQDLLSNIIEIEHSPSTPITTHRKMKILFAGLDDSGKTSFLLSVDRKYSKLIGLKPTAGASIKSIEALGATIFLWDLGGQKRFREKYIDKAEIYLYEADLMFYFIDIKNKARFDESIEYLQNLKDVLKDFNQDTPIVYIMSKGDSDILENEEIQNNIEFIESKLREINQNQHLEIYITSIFQIFTILRAFSSGISKLSPNRDLINHNLKNFSLIAETYLTQLLSVDGLVLADYYSNQAMQLTKIPKSEVINVFEVSAPQFAVLFKIFDKFKALKQDEAVFKVANSVIIFQRIQIEDNIMFFLFLVDDERKRDKIKKELSAFLKYTEDLLLRYIA